MSIGAKVYQGTSPSTLIATLSQRKEPNWFHQFNDTGSGSIMIHALDTDLAAHPTIVNYDNIVRVNIDGTDRFAFLIEKRSLDVAAKAELAGKWWTLEGRGVLALLEDAIVEPEGTIAGSTLRQRTFGFMSAAFDDSAWTAAVQLRRQDTIGGTPSWYAHKPAGWPDPSAYWIWSRAYNFGTLPYMPAGTCYFRTTFTLAAETFCAIFATCDDDCAVWLDDELIIGGSTGTVNWQEPTRYDRTLAAGMHTIAVQATNADRGATANPAGFICSVMELDDTSTLTGTVIKRTNNTWKALDYPASVPGMTIGQILGILIDEAQTRGALTGITLGFSDTTDSNSAAWSVTPDLALDIGTNYLDVIRTLVEQFIDVEMSPTLVLDCYAKGTLGSNLTATVSLIVGTDLEQLGARGEEDGGLTHVANALLLRDQNGILVEREDTTSQASHKRKEAYIELATAPSPEAAEAAGDAILDTNAYPSVQLSGVTVRKAYTSFNPGDFITVVNMQGVNTDTQVLAFSISEDDAGNPIYAFTASQLDS